MTVSMKSGLRDRNNRYGVSLKQAEIDASQ